jgi:hypothetical protein
MVCYARPASMMAALLLVVFLVFGRSVGHFFDAGALMVAIAVAAGGAAVAAVVAVAVFGSIQRRRAAAGGCVSCQFRCQHAMTEQPRQLPVVSIESRPGPAVGAPRWPDRPAYRSGPAVVASRAVIGSPPAMGSQPVVRSPPVVGSRPVVGSPPVMGSPPGVGSRPVVGSPPVMGSPPVVGSRPVERREHVGSAVLTGRLIDVSGATALLSGRSVLGPSLARPWPVLGPLAVMPVWAVVRQRRVVRRPPGIAGRIGALGSSGCTIDPLIHP